MARDLINRYVWIIDTLNRYGRLTREELNRQWMRSSLCDGKEIPERTFYHYRRAIEENFRLEICCDNQGRYYISDQAEAHNKILSNWLLDSYAVNTAMKELSVASDRVSVEEVPSAREFLSIVLDAIGSNQKISFTYGGFNRSRPERDIVFQPYFAKRYKQRWYMVGYKEKSAGIRTYALDRVREMNLMHETFEMPPDLTPDDYFAHTIGVTHSKAQVRTVRLRTNTTQAKYFRALPLHASQQEEVHDNYSIFTYRLKLNYELVHEILGLGNNVTVLEPRELRLMVINELKETLEQYEQ